MFRAKIRKIFLKNHLKINIFTAVKYYCILHGQCLRNGSQKEAKPLRIVRGQAKILVVVTFERHLAYLRTMKLA